MTGFGSKLGVFKGFRGQNSLQSAHLGQNLDSDPGLQLCTLCARARRCFGGRELPIEASESAQESAQAGAMPGEFGRKARSFALGLGLALFVLAIAATAAAAWWLNNERTRLQHEIIQQSLQVLELREKLTRTEVTLQERTAALATRDAALAEANRPVIPVRVTFRLAFMGQGLVASIRNVTDRPLNVIAELRDAGADPARTVSLALGANGATEIGYAQGWTITSGQSITVSSSGYRSVTAFAP